MLKILHIWDFFCNFAVDKNKEPFKDYYYEDLQPHGQAMCNPHPSTEQERGRPEAPGARRGR